jgi:hypothetical protein
MVYWLDTFSHARPCRRLGLHLRILTFSIVCLLMLDVWYERFYVFAVLCNVGSQIRTDVEASSHPALDPYLISVVGASQIFC